MSNPLFYTGTSGWTYNHWKGDFYPEKLPRARWFSYYASQFAAVEINATFYRAFADRTYLKWRDQVEAGFRYALKIPRLITHRKLLEGCEEELRSFWRSAQLLQDRLGMVLLQLAPGMPCDLQKLRTALLAFGDPSRVAVEFRSECWQDLPVRPLLEELGAAYVSVDSPRACLAGWLASQGAKEIYIFFNNDVGGYAPHNALALKEMLAKG
jgi:uncharacterized protein YecE (DUF72 family)